MFNVPILFITYKRFSTAEKVFNKIREIKPKKLYFASNIPPRNNFFEQEFEKVKKVRNLVSTIDWNCKVIKIFHKEYLPVAASIPSAINFFFKKESNGIILEDDCLASRDFFLFCRDMLKKYSNKNINLISGSRFVPVNKNNELYFSKYNHIWGWASWRKSWNRFDINIKFWKNFKKSDRWKKFHVDIKERKYWEKIFDRVYNKKINTWDYSWTATAWYYNQLSIIPPVKLVKNIGFGPDATWTVSVKKQKIRPIKNKRLKNYNTPVEIVQNKKYDQIVFQRHFKGYEKDFFSLLIKFVLVFFTNPKLLYLKLTRNMKNFNENF